MKPLLNILFPVLFLVAISAQRPPFSVVEATIADMQSAMQDGRVTSRAIVQEYLDRIARYEHRLTPSSP